MTAWLEPRPEQAERFREAPFAAIVQRRDPEIRLTALNLFEYRGQISDRGQLDAMAEAAEGAQMANTIKRPRKGDPRRVDEQLARPGDVPQQARDRTGWQAAVAVRQVRNGCHIDVA